MPARIEIINEGPETIVLTENGVNLRYIPPHSKRNSVVYKQRSISIAIIEKD